MITVTRKSDLTGKVHSLEMNIDPVKWEKWESGEVQEYIQNYFPELSRDEREFILSGSTKEEWDEAFPIEEDI